MELTIVFVSLLSCFAVAMNSTDKDIILANDDERIANLSDPNKDMYVIHAMVYQVGIITNKTDDGLNNTNLIGNQEAVTFYHNNGSGIDLSSIPAPLLTNVTAQRMVGVAPTVVHANSTATLPWVDLEKLASAQNPPLNTQDPIKSTRQARSISIDSDAPENNPKTIPNSDYFDESRPEWETLYERSTENDELYRKDGSHNNKSLNKPYKNNVEQAVKIVSGTTVVPKEASVQSISIPPLLTLNNNFSEIPVPIPNTSVVHYAKVSTLIH
ncbi:uncharacterized protein LOC126380038 [Pectinophora gossypiella]|uniref:uncharacterized protein LOC126380038 n=1 Tax=Pectinophora gossypiella TaxID=13191 RepID=UPI00214DFAE3|nr:uncharacterized protein LOC126380038 [Pectinophora gossypiella]